MKKTNGYVMSDENGLVFDANCDVGRAFIKWANWIAAASDDPEDPLTYDKTQLGADGVAESYFHDSSHVYFVRDEPGAALTYVGSR